MAREEQPMSPEDREEKDRRRWERFDREYYGMPFRDYTRLFLMEDKEEQE